MFLGRKVFITASILAVAFSCVKERSSNSGLEQNQCAVDNSFAEEYREDATYLLYREIVQDSTTHPDYKNPFFNAETIGHYLEELQAIERLNTAYTDTLFYQKRIRVFSWFSARNMILKVDRQSHEIQNLKAGQPSGNVTYDAMAEDFGLHMNDNLSSAWVLFSVDDLYNLFPIKEQLKTLPFILAIDKEGTGGITSNIKREPVPQGTLYTFTYGWGDCPAGCMFARHWEFLVKDNCQVSFVGSYGDVIQQ